MNEPLLPELRKVSGYVSEQPAVLAATLRALAADPRARRWAQGPYRAVRLVGSGSSRNALQVAAHRFSSLHRCPVTVEGPREYLRTDLGNGEGDLAVVVSQTGTSTTTIEALEAAQASHALTLAVTADPGSPFGRRSRETVVLPVGREDVGPKTKGFTATVAGLARLAELTAPPGSTGGDLPDAEAYERALRELVPRHVALGARLAAAHSGRGHVMVVGTGRFYGAALEGSLKLQEMAGTSASCFELEESLHGRFHGLSEGDLALFLVGEEEDEAVASAAAGVLLTLGVAAEVLSTVDGAAEPPGVTRLPVAARVGGLDVVDVVVALQSFAVLAAEAWGADPDAMRYPGLSQRLEIKTDT